MREGRSGLAHLSFSIAVVAGMRDLAKGWLWSLALLALLCTVGSQRVLAQQEEAAAEQAAPAPDSLEELLSQVRRGRLDDGRQAREREARFRASQEQQAQLLEEARQERTRQEELSVRLEKAHEDNEAQIALKTAQLTERKGYLTELFGHLTASTGDALSNFELSLISIQYPDRKEFLRSLLSKIESTSDQLPQLEEIERLWFELHQEMTESGRVVRFKAPVLRPDGTQYSGEVVRVGSFNILSGEGRYLSYNARTGVLEELPRQPARNFIRMAGNLVSAQGNEWTKVGIDPTGPTGGSYLSALINSPTLRERWHQGGVIGYIITGIGIFAFLLAIWRLLYLSVVKRKVNSQLRNPANIRAGNPLGRVLTVQQENPGLDSENLELKLSEAVLRETPGLEKSQALLRIIAAVAPLMGLLGTVTGMIITFQQITIFGAGDPKAMAGGISTALVTTVLGLIVAIPTVLLHTLVSGRSRHIIQILEEQSLGLVAQRIDGGKASAEA